MTMPIITVINYGAGNLPNVVRALEHVGATIHVTDDANVVRSAHAVVLPGVGATRDTMQSLAQLQLLAVLPEIAASGKPFLGICVGMQVLCTQSEEFGTHPCLNIVDGKVERFPAGQYKIPQIGWNQVTFTPHAQHHPFFAGIPNSSDFYFVHSYYCNLKDPAIVAAQTDYGCSFPSVLIRENVIATQFHPEKSGKLGLKLLQNFVAMCDRHYQT
jgi:glutamine amidotransferase